MAGGIPFGFGVEMVPPVPRRMPQDIPAAPFGFAPPPSKWDQIKQVLWESNINAPVRGVYNLMNTPYDVLAGGSSPEFDAAVGNSFDAAGGITVGSMPMPKPANSLSMGIKAFHGSPHSFDKFSMDKIGTGEGAQAYGHGLYFAENEGVARSYKDAGKPSYVDSTRINAAKGVLAEAGGDVRRATDLAFQKMNEALSAKDRNAYHLWQDVQNNFSTLVGESHGSMYEVNIDADPNAFLDWDKPLSEQPEAVKKAFSGIDKSINARGDQYWPSQYEDMGEWYNHFKGKQINAPQVSERLRDAGIPGIKYLDAGSRGPSTIYNVGSPKDGFGPYTPFTSKADAEKHVALLKRQGFQDAEIRIQEQPQSRNYVVFDDKLISIVRKYGIAGASALLGYNVMDGLSDAQAAELKRAEKK